MMLNQFITRETGLQEQLCEHGIGHPTVASAKKWADRYKQKVEAWLAHGCDGCCEKAENEGLVNEKRICVYKGKT